MTISEAIDEADPLKFAREIAFRLNVERNLVRSFCI